MGDIAGIGDFSLSSIWIECDIIEDFFNRGIFRSFAFME